MPETHQGYHLFQLCGKDTEEAISFSEFRNDLGDGFRSQVLFGASTGLRRWNISFPSLAGAVASSTITVNGVAMNPADYLWDLFCTTKVNGTPFVIQSKKNDQYYLAEFVDDELSYRSIYAKLFTSGINLKQVRLRGVTVFDVSKLSPWAWYTDAFSTVIVQPFPGGWGWMDSSGNGRDLLSDTTSDILPVDDVQNGKSVARVNSDTGSSYFVGSDPILLKQLFIVFKMREVTFSNNAGVFSTASTENPLLRGVSGDTKFFDFNYDADQAYFYAKNGITYPESNQQAPMDTFGLVYIKAPEGAPVTALQLGKDRNVAGTYAKVDYGEIIPFATPIPDDLVQELAEHLTTRWDIH